VLCPPGKTEASKKIMQYIAAVTGSGADIERVKNQLLRSNPVLEAFGNAKTQRNNNSSRFGKYQEIFFDYKGDPVGGRVQNFLLEKSRVISQLPDERSFHIFYGLLAGVTGQQRQQLQLLAGPADYSYLNKNGVYTVDRMDDREEWGECMAGMQAMSMSETEIGHVRSILAAVLWLGNIDFVAEGADKSRIANMKPVEVAASLLGCDVKLLAQGMVQRTYTANKQDVLTPLNAEQAKYTRDALAKAIYFRLFDYIVARINEAIKINDSGAAASSSSKSKTKSVRTIGVLDIYGFEIFVSNSFEQCQ
jgi:myosin-1